LRSGAPVEGLGDIARAHLASLAQRLELVQSLSLQARNIQKLRELVPGIGLAVDQATEALRIAQEELAILDSRVVEMPPSTVLSGRARQLERLVAIGAEIGRIEARCPLCASDIDHTHFQEGMEAAITAAKSLDANAVEQARRESARDASRETVTEAEKACGVAIARQSAAQTEIADFEARCASAKLNGNDPQALALEITNLEQERAAISAELRIVDTIGVSRLLSRATEEEAVARDRVARAEGRLGRARLGETGAKAIYDAARRAAAETLDQRLIVYYH
jgi:chromosome segregation protein